jgi:hypothetical protein
MMGNPRLGLPNTISSALAAYRDRRWKKTKKGKKGVMVGVVEENGKKTIPYSFKPPVWLQFRNGADTFIGRPSTVAAARAHRALARPV